MMMGILLIVGIYGLCAAIIHTVHYIRHKAGRPRAIHLVLIAKNNASHMEWYLYSFLFFSWLRGRLADVTVFDNGSTDDTCAIVRKVARGRPYIRLYESTRELDRFLEEHDQQPMLLLHLDQVNLNPEQALHLW
ncbi:hypothetical protein MJA45_00495 [Paenibacillus aurantius]|uniref:Glycosyltransferase 2-like domain-containing protein n=1 Tax=Paenibacillus aurantius TaxID=2918900 RepID=A0AA96RFT6_9BACL|nr:hypothetical protein [Paenibacillus aurantius]WNQ11593.1 hypothetical protein MJA45_00495 [Paenibacillus aurantius]